MNIKILGTGCPKCKKLYANVKNVMDELGIDCEIEKVEEIDKIMEYGIMLTPGLVINEKTVAAGRVATESEIKDYVNKATGEK